MRHAHSSQIKPIDNEPYHHRDLRRALISAAIELMTEELDWTFSLREVARRAGVSHNAPYNHFDSKQALLAAVAATGYDMLCFQMEQAAAKAETSSSRLKAIGVAYVGFGVENPAHYRLMFGKTLASLKEGLPSTLWESTKAAKKVLHDVIEEGAQDGSFAVSAANASELDLVVLSAWSIVHGLTMLLIDGVASSETTSNLAAHISGQVTQIFLDGIGIKHNK